MGWALVEPGDRPRSRALSEEAVDAVTVVVGVVPAFVLAAVIEGFVTGHGGPGAPVQIGLGVAVGLAYLLFLFGLPLRRTRGEARADGGPGHPGTVVTAGP